MESSTLAGSRYLDLPYRLILTKEKRKGANAWLALVEELPGCVAHGDTPEEAALALREEMAIWISHSLENGQPIPRPHTEPGSPDGRLSLEIPHSLHESLTLAAIREGLTVNQLVMISLAGLVHWRPEQNDTNGRMIRARADRMTRRQNGSPGLNRALMLNAALLGLVVFAAVIILIVAVAKGF